MRRRRRLSQNQPAPESATPPLVGGSRRGLLPRARAALMRRGVLKALAAPAVAPLVAVAVVAVFAAIAVGVVLGAALASQRGGGDWT